jgi:hypothetical protein
MCPVTPRLQPLRVPSIHDSDVPESILYSSASGESDATSLNEGVDKGFQSSKNEVPTEQRNTDAKSTEELKTLVEIEDATKETSQKHGKCGKTRGSPNSRRNTSSDDCSSSESGSSSASTDFETGDTLSSSLREDKFSKKHKSKAVLQQGQLQEQRQPHARQSLSKPQYFRVDELWDDEVHAFKLTETVAATDEDKHGESIFQVRRRFDYDGKYTETVVDIKSKVLRNFLRTVMSSCKAVSLEEDTPTVDPDMFFLYLEDIKKHYKKMNGKSGSNRKPTHKAAAKGATHLKCLIGYVEQDYKRVDKALYPLIEAGNITFDLLWTLFRSDEIVYTSTYSVLDEPRAFKVDHVTKGSSRVKGTWYEIQGRYIDFDGKAFGLGNIIVKIDSFKGPKRLNSLPCYPIKYHKDCENVQKQLIERGKKFVTLAGMNYKSHIGLGFTKLDGEVIKVTINSRVMVDPQTFRRINPNYPVSDIQVADLDLPIKTHRESDDEECCSYGNVSSKWRPLLVDRHENAGPLELEVDDNRNRPRKEAKDKSDNVAQGAIYFNESLTAWNADSVTALFSNCTGFNGSTSKTSLVGFLRHVPISTVTPPLPYLDVSAAWFRSACPMETDRLCWRSLSVMLDDDRARKHYLLHLGLPSRKIYEIKKNHSFHEAEARKPRTSTSRHF